MVVRMFIRKERKEVKSENVFTWDIIKLRHAVSWKKQTQNYISQWLYDEFGQPMEFLEQNKGREQILLWVIPFWLLKRRWMSKALSTKTHKLKMRTCEIKPSNEVGQEEA